METFPAYLMTAPGEGGVVEMKEQQLHDRELNVRVEYSALNYKDALAITGKAPVLKEYPMVPGIDLAGTVLDTQFSAFPTGTSIIATGNGVGEVTWGGFSKIVHIRSGGVTALPKSLSSRHAAALGTAGLTAALCAIPILERFPDFREQQRVLVTGATGGVGSLAVMLLSSLGYKVTAVTGRPDEFGDYLRNLGADCVIARDELTASVKPLGKTLCSAGVNTVGGDILAGVLKSTYSEGIVTACGMAGSGELATTVYPFILRGITLRGINSVEAPGAARWRAWEMLATYIDRDKLDEITQEITLSQLPEFAQKMLNNETHGRIIVRPEV